MFDYDAAQQYLGGVSRSTLKTLVGRGEIEIIRIGEGRGRTMFTRDGLERYVERQRSKMERLS